MKITWSKKARNSYTDIIDFLLQRWTIEIAVDFENKVLSIIQKLKVNVRLCQKTSVNGFRKCVIHPNVSLIYRVVGNDIQIIDLIDNRSRSVYYNPPK